MPTNQGLLQQSIRERTGTALSYNGDWLALCDDQSIAAGDWNGRVKALLDQHLGTTHVSLPAAMQAFADDHGAANFNEVGAFKFAQNGADFDGSAAYLNGLDGSSITDNKQFLFSGWFKLDDVSLTIGGQLVNTTES